MKSSIVVTFTAILALINTAQAYFYVPSFMNTLPFKDGMAFAQKNNSLYLFGGENATVRYTNELYKLTQTSTSYTWESVPQQNAPAGVLYSQSYITADGSNMVLLGGVSNTTYGAFLPMQIYTYNFANQSWTAGSGNGGNATSNSTFLNRVYFSASYDKTKQLTYIFGGAVLGSESMVLNDLYSMDANNQVTQLKSTPYARYGHTAQVLSDGRLVVLGGVLSTGSQSGLASMENAWVYDPSSSSWSSQNISSDNGYHPSTASDLTSVVTSDDKIIIFGGDNAGTQRTRQYLNSVAILDTKTWSWTIPTVGGIPPSRRSFAVAGLLDSNHVTFAFGGSSNSYYNDINTYDISGSAWLQTFSDSTSSGDGSVSKGLIAGVTIAAIVLLVIILFLLWKFQSYVRWLIVRIHNDIWKPRTGEPIWAETSRIVSQVILLFVFIMFLYFVIRQAIDSPNVTQRIEYAAAEVDVPDVRFCFDGFPNDQVNGGPTGVSCQTDTGYPCSSYVKQLNMSVFQPTFSDNLGTVNCFLFRASDDFKMASTSGANNGSRLLFTMWGDQTYSYGRIHVSVFPKNMDPNAVIYGYNDSISNYLSEADVLTWQISERNDLQSTNVYTIQPFTYSALSYDIIDHRYLQPVGWNYVGFLPVTNSTPEIETNFRSEAPNPTYTSGHADLGLLAVFPEDYAKLIDREIKMYTLVNGLGFVGGIFGILIAIQAWLFGYRPRSPWGVVHRWSTGSRKQSLLNGLQQKFKTTDSGIPLVHPVHHRFSMNEFQDLGYETEAQRVSRVEERMQILELLFKAYYVDDEVFRSLDNASHTPGKQQQQPQSFNTINPQYAAAPSGFPTPTEKLSPYHQKDDQNGFSHMFNERQSVSSDSNSQQNLTTQQDVHLNNMRHDE